MMPWLKTVVVVLMLGTLGIGSQAQANEWLTAPDGPVEQLLADDWPAGEKPHRSGGIYWHRMAYQSSGSAQVIDFKNSSLIGEFSHFIFNQQGRLVWARTAGLTSLERSDHFLRHGMTVDLPAGDYTILTEIRSPFFIAGPAPVLFDLADYQRRIQPANATVLIGLGIFIGLGFYYLVMGLWRQSQSDLLYAAFILGNLIYNAAALVVLKTYSGSHSVFWTSLPIVISNLVYIWFVVRLLGINRHQHLWPFRIALLVSSVLLSFWLLVAIWPQLSMEFARYGVYIFGLFGLTMAIWRSLQGSKVARIYLIANIVFLVPALVAISASSFVASDIWQIEHLGLIAVLCEVLMLAQVMSYRVGQLNEQRVQAERRMQRALAMAEQAQYDSLTNLPSRRLLDKQLRGQAQTDSSVPMALLFIDLDNLKATNDAYGHAAGDEMLITTAKRIQACVRKDDYVARLGGDEFIVLLRNVTTVDQAMEIAQTILDALTRPVMINDYSVESGASIGVVHFPSQTSDISQLIHMADTAMYEAKRRGKNCIQLSH